MIRCAAYFPALESRPGSLQDLRINPGISPKNVFHNNLKRSSLFFTRLEKLRKESCDRCGMKVRGVPVIYWALDLWNLRNTLMKRKTNWFVKYIDWWCIACGTCQCLKMKAREFEIEKFRTNLYSQSVG